MCDDAVRFRVEREVKAQDVGFGEEGAATFGDIESGCSRAPKRSLSPPAQNSRTERPSHVCYQAADAAKGVDAEDFSLHANPKRRLPVSPFQSLCFVRDVAQRGENKPPGKLRGGVRSGKASRRDHHAVLGAGVDVDMSSAAPSLADELEPGQTLDQRSRKWRACLGEDDGFNLFQPLG